MLEPEKKQASGKEQIAVSRGNIEAHLRTHNDGITGLLLKNDKSEKERRAVEEVRRVQRYNEIQNEAIQSAKNNAALEMRWAELKEEEQCERLFEAIEEQKKLFSQLIDSKDKLIQEFWDELKRKDDEYVKNLREQATEIDELISKMRTQFREMRETYLMELEEIEKEYNQERKETMMKNEDEIKKQFAKHAELEKKSVDSRDEREKKYAKDFEDLRVTGAKNYAEKKIMHETECQNLEKCFEDMKALYLLNSEKLEYYLKVLKEKDDENKALFLNLKNKAQTLNAKHRTLNAEYKDVDNAFENNNKQLTDEYKRISAAFKKLQDKFKHFERADLDRYSEIQKMNEVEVVELKSKILKADRTIHIQHLGLVWTPPEESTENKDGNMADASKSHSTSMLKQSQPAPEAKPGIDEVKKEITVDIPEEHLTVMIDLLIDESDFLLDDLVREQSTRLGKMKKLVMILDQIKKYLAIDSPEEMNIFLEFMYKNTLRRGFGSVLPKSGRKRRNRGADGEEGQEEGDGELPEGEDGENLEDEENFDENEEFDDGFPIDEMDPEGIRKVFDQNKFIPALTKFMEDKPERKKTLEEVLAKKARKEETEREKKERIAREGKKYWENLTNVLPEKSIRLWKVLDKAFAKYYSVLEERQRLIEETTQLHNQNEELRNLLNQYLQINHELIIPPTSTIKMDQMS